MRLNVPHTSSVQALQKEQHYDRKRQVAFGGVNILCFGDFWQLDPTGDTSFMSNPTKTTGNPLVDWSMNMFWHQAPNEHEQSDHLQVWQGKSRVWELSQNIRSGADTWFLMF